MTAESKLRFPFQIQIRVVEFRFAQWNKISIKTLDSPKSSTCFPQKIYVIDESLTNFQEVDLIQDKRNSVQRRSLAYQIQVNLKDGESLDVSNQNCRCKNLVGLYCKNLPSVGYFGANLKKEKVKESLLTARSQLSRRTLVVGCFKKCKRKSS